MSNTDAIAFENLGKSFRGRIAISGISFSVRKGEIFGLLGHNGAGKSTTFGIALGHVRADTGRVVIGGIDVAADRASALSKTGAIFETPSFYDYLSGWRNLEFYVSLSGWLPRERLMEAVHLVGLAERIHDPVRAYSHGMRQRLALAAALLPDPQLVLLDEPTEGLDPSGIHEIRSLILRLRKEQGITFVLSSHLLHEVERLCDRVAILHRGELVFCGEWKEADRPLWQVDTPDLEAARKILGAFGVSPDCDGRFAFEGDPARAVAALVAGGVRVREFRRIRRTLEDFYLEKSCAQ